MGFDKTEVPMTVRRQLEGEGGCPKTYNCPYIHDFLVIFTLMTVYKTVSHHNGPFSTASKHKNEKVLIHMR